MHQVHVAIALSKGEYALTDPAQFLVSQEIGMKERSCLANYAGTTVPDA